MSFPWSQYYTLVARKKPWKRAPDVGRQDPFPTSHPVGFNPCWSPQKKEPGRIQLRNLPQSNHFNLVPWQRWHCLTTLAAFNDIGVQAAAGGSESDKWEVHYSGRQANVSFLYLGMRIQSGFISTTGSPPLSPNKYTLPIYYVYIYIYICLCVCVTYRSRNREKEREREAYVCVCMCKFDIICAPFTTLRTCGFQYLWVSAGYDPQWLLFGGESKTHTGQMSAN